MIFHVPALYNRLNEFRLCIVFLNAVKVYIDTLKLARRVYPKEVVVNYKQVTLVRN